MFNKTAFIWAKVQIVIYSSDGEAEFSASLLHSSLSHDPSEIILINWFGAQETFLIFISVEIFSV